MAVIPYRYHGCTECGERGREEGERERGREREDRNSLPLPSLKIDLTLF